MSFDSWVALINNLPISEESTKELKDAITKFEKQKKLLDVTRLELRVLQINNLRRKMDIFTGEMVLRNQQELEAESVEAKKVMDAALDECFKLGVDIRNIDTNKLLNYNRMVYNAMVAEKKPEMQAFVEKWTKLYELMENRPNVQRHREQLRKNDALRKELELKEAANAAKLEKSKKSFEEARLKYDEAKRNLAEMEKELEEDRKKATELERLKNVKQQRIAQLKPLQEKKPLFSICNNQEQKTSTVKFSIDSLGFLQQFRKETQRIAPAFDFFSNIKQNVPTAKSDEEEEEELSTQSILRKPTAIDQHQGTALPRLQKRVGFFLEDNVTRSDSSDVEHVASLENELDAIHIAKDLETEQQRTQTSVVIKQQAAKSGSGELQVEKALRGKDSLPLVAKVCKEKAEERKENVAVSEPKIEILENRLIQKAVNPVGSMLPITSSDFEEDDPMNSDVNKSTKDLTNFPEYSGLFDSSPSSKKLNVKEKFSTKSNIHKSQPKAGIVSDDDSTTTENEGRKVVPDDFKNFFDEYLKYSMDVNDNAATTSEGKENKKKAAMNDRPSTSAQDTVGTIEVGSLSFGTREEVVTVHAKTTEFFGFDDGEMSDDKFSFDFGFEGFEGASNSKNTNNFL